jgi:hypothetical protein
MSKCRTAGPLSAIAILAFVASPHSADATVIIKTFRFSICVTGEKHPDGCKNAHADAHLVVPDSQMEDLDGEVGQGATIMAPSRPGESPRANQRITGAVIRMKRLRSRTCNGR